MKKYDPSVLLLLTTKRERKRLKRLAKFSISRGRSFIKNQQNRAKIVVPAILDLEENRAVFIRLLDQIQNILLKNMSFVIDHRQMKKITKSALLLLTSEIERCTKIMGIKLRAKSKFVPVDFHVKSLLDKIGYWDYFNLNFGSSKLRNDNDNELHLKIVGDTQVSGEKIGCLIEFFENSICFDFQTKEKFSDALMEAAANTVEHAYSENNKIGHIKKWWLTASLNTTINEISFIFYDQGLGILNTLETSQKNIKFKRLVAGWISEGLSKGGLLRKLVTTNLSSYKDERRGNGLISFKTFIDQVQGGELTIHTDDVSYSAIEDKITNHTTSIRGTLIIWNIRPNKESDKCIYIRENKL